MTRCAASAAIVLGIFVAILCFGIFPKGFALGATLATAGLYYMFRTRHS